MISREMKNQLAAEIASLDLSPPDIMKCAHVIEKTLKINGFSIAVESLYLDDE